MQSIPVTYVASGVGPKDFIYITSNSEVRAVLTRSGIWYASVSFATREVTTSKTGKLSMHGSTRWFLMSQEWLRSWLSGEQDLIESVADVISELKTMNALSGTGKCSGKRLAMNSLHAYGDSGASHEG